MCVSIFHLVLGKYFSFIDPLFFLMICLFGWLVVCLYFSDGLSLRVLRLHVSSAEPCRCVLLTPYFSISSALHRLTFYHSLVAVATAKIYIYTHAHKRPQTHTHTHTHTHTLIDSWWRSNCGWITCGPCGVWGCWGWPLTSGAPHGD